MPLFRRSALALAYDDLETNSNPQRRFFDWRRDVTGVPVESPQSQRITVDPFTEVTIFNGSRTLGADGLTEFALTVSPLAPTRYRLTWTGIGAAPAFRVDRALALGGGTVTLTLQPNTTVAVVSSLGAVFGAVVVGDTVLVPGTSTGDAALFNPLNEGTWTVLAASATTLTLARAAGAVFSGATETVSLTANTQVQAYSAAGVQAGDTLDVVAGFSLAARSTYDIVTATARYIEFFSSLPLPAETVVPGATALAVYTAAKRYVYVEANQEVAVKLNGATDERVRVEPMLPGDPNGVGWFEKWGPTFSLVVRNRSTTRATVYYATAE